MEKINELLGKLDNRVTPNIAKRLEGLKKLNEKVALAEQEHLDNPTNESEESLEDIKVYVSEVTDDLVGDLEDLLKSKKNQIAEKEAQEKEAQEKDAKEKESEQKLPVVEEKKKGFGVFGLITGVVLLVASVGVINVMKNNK